VQHESHLKTGVTPRCPEAYAARMTQFLKVEIQAIEILGHSFLLCGLLPPTLCDKVCQLLATGRWFSPDTLFPTPIKLTITIELKYC
jgi:hypothetical protein